MQLIYKKRNQLHNTWARFEEFTTIRLIMHLLLIFLNIENKNQFDSATLLLFNKHIL